MMMNPFRFLFSSADNRLVFSISNNWKEAEKSIDEIGFAVIPLFSAEELSVVEQHSIILLSDIQKENKLEEFLAVGRIDDKTIRNQSTQIINELVFPKLKEFMKDTGYDFVSGIHLLKPKGKKGVLNPHQDSSLVDESIHKSYFFWLPVSATGVKEGPLEVIPGSHRLKIPFRTLNIPWPLVPVQMKLWKFMKKVIVPSGHAVIFHSALIHASGENKTNTIRIAVNSFIKPESAPLLHYYTDDSSDYKTIESFEITPDFFYNEDIMKKPDAKYKLYKQELNTNQAYTLEELQQIFK